MFHDSASPEKDGAKGTVAGRGGRFGAHSPSAGLGLHSLLPAHCLLATLGSTCLRDTLLLVTSPRSCHRLPIFGDMAERGSGRNVSKRLVCYVVQETHNCFQMIQKLTFWICSHRFHQKGDHQKHIRCLNFHFFFHARLSKVPFSVKKKPYSSWDFLKVRTKVFVFFTSFLFPLDPFPINLISTS